MSVKSVWFAMVLLGGLMAECSAYAAELPSRMIVSDCKYQQLKGQVRLITQANHYSLIEAVLDDELLAKLHSNDGACGKFLNLAPFEQNSQSPEQLLFRLTQISGKRSGKTFTLKHEQEVRKALELISRDSIWQTMQHVTSYYNRSAKTKSGLAAAYWYQQEFDRMAKESGRADVESYFVKTGNKYEQPSVVTVIGKDKPGEAVVLGAHIDTLGGNMPGADDDASGIAVALEISRVLLSSGIALQHPVYIIAYAAEEQGLVGSSYVVNSFVKKNIAVKGVMQFDQAGFRANPEDKTIWLLDDYVDKSLTAFTAELLTHYVQVPVAYTHCGYACSDHANWTRAGYAATYPSATTLENDNPYVHSSKDTLHIISLEHMYHFAQLGLAFALESGL